MKLRRMYPPLTVILGVAVGVLPAIAISEPSPSIEAVNTGSGIYGEGHAWSPSQVSLGEGGVVAFQNSSSTVPHGVEWVAGPAKPTCSSGVPVGMGAAASGTGWNGTCTFVKPGVYTFYCTVHGPEMTGRITVNASGTTTVTQPVMPPTAPGSTTPPPSPSGEPGTGPAPGSPLAGAISQAVKLARSQHGKSVRGSVQVSQAGVGGRLEVDLLARGASPARAGHPVQLQVGRLVRSSLYAGPVSFAVPLNVRGKAALARHRRLALTVRIVLTPIGGAAVTVSRPVVIHF